MVGRYSSSLASGGASSRIRIPPASSRISIRSHVLPTRRTRPRTLTVVESPWRATFGDPRRSEGVGRAPACGVVRSMSWANREEEKAPKTHTRPPPRARHGRDTLGLGRPWKAAVSGFLGFGTTTAVGCRRVAAGERNARCGLNETVGRGVPCPLRSTHAQTRAGGPCLSSTARVPSRRAPACEKRTATAARCTGCGMLDTRILGPYAAWKRKNGWCTKQRRYCDTYHQSITNLWN
jgi:hypothetical protein